MEFFKLSITGFVLRLYLLMAIVLVAGFTGIWALALLALPVFVSGMLGVSFGEKPTTQSEVLTGEAQIVDLEISGDKSAATQTGAPALAA